jgi:hypothetical protein
MEVRLGSVVPHGVDGTEAAAISLIYEFLLKEYKQNFYRRIGINQIGEGLDEIILRQPGNKIHVNIRYIPIDDFEKKDKNEKNRIRLEIIHQALLKIAAFDKKLEIATLEKIRRIIIKNNFSFEFICKTYRSKENSNTVAHVSVVPEMNVFYFYASILKSNKEICKTLIFSGNPTVYYFKYFFKSGKWMNTNEFVISGTLNEVNTVIQYHQCIVVIVNLTKYQLPPFYTLMNFNSTNEEKQKAYNDWQHSLPPEMASVIRQADN